MNSTRVYKKSKKQTVQLTSLLDLLFVMIFVSLIQQKEVVKPTPKPVKKPVAKVQAKPKPKKIVKTPPKPQPVIVSTRATFHFYATPSNPSVPEGKFLMSGIFSNKDNTLNLGGLSWIKRPANFDMVGLKGTFDDSFSSFTGRVELIGCQRFTLRKESGGDKQKGVWKGTYNCSQGDTGLTLTIE